MAADFLAALRRHAVSDPVRIAMRFTVEDERSEYTIGQLVADIDAAIAARRYGQPGELVFIACAIGYDTIVAYLACLANGAVPAFLSPMTARQDAAIHAREQQALCDRFEPNLLVDEQGVTRFHARPNPHVAGHTGFLQFSSGTTSLRKGVLITEQKLMAQLDSLGRRLAITPQDRIASWLPLYHDMGLITTLFLPLYHGCLVHYLDPVEWSFRPDAIFKLIAEERATLCWQPDFAFRHLVNFYRRTGFDKAPDLSSLRRLINCSEPCRKSSFLAFAEAFVATGLRPDALQSCYAMAETVYAITQAEYPDVASTPAMHDILSSGTPIDGCALRIVPVPDSEFGEIHVKSDFLFDGYLNQVTTTISADGWYNTSDLGVLQDGQLFVLGRVDDTLIVNGKKIIAHQIEDYLGQQPGFKPGRVFCTLNADGSALRVYYEGEVIADAQRNALRKWTATSAGVTLDALVLVDAGVLVKSSSGKIARKKTLAKLNDMQIA